MLCTFGYATNPVTSFLSSSCRNADAALILQARNQPTIHVVWAVDSNCYEYGVAFSRVTNVVLEYEYMGSPA